MGGRRLTVDNISIAFNNEPALMSVSFEVMPSEHFFILGPSGCGKSTLLKIIAGLEQPHEGNIDLDGKGIILLPPEKRPINTVFQNYALFPHLNVYNNIGFGLKLKKIPKLEIRARVYEALSLVKMNGYENRSVKTLSGGEQQRVAIARALINNPDILLLDEPLAALDAKLKVQMLKDLREIKSKLNTTFIHVTHDQNEAISLADRIAVMNKGKIIQIDTPEKIYNAPKNKFVASFIGKMNFFNAEKLNFEPNGLASSAVKGFKIKAKANSQIRESSKKMIIAVRPENIQIFRNKNKIPKQLSNQALATLKGIVFMGDRFEYTLTIDNQEISIVKQCSVNDNLNIGEVVSVAWSPNDTVILEEQ